MPASSPVAWVALIAGGIASGLCFFAGAMLLQATSDSDPREDDFATLWNALGWYFVAKGFFLGPSLAIAGLAYDRTRTVSAPSD